MKTIHWLLMGILCLFVSSCGSDEPDAPYTGPWEISYLESYVGIHNNSQEFIDWFNQHTNDFEIAYFSSRYENVCFDDYIELNDYKHYTMGEIYWREIVTQATEDDIKAKVLDFESFTITDEKDNNKADLFQAEYQRYDGK